MANTLFKVVILKAHRLQGRHHLQEERCHWYYLPAHFGIRKNSLFWGANLNM